MLIFSISIVVGLMILVLSADKFVDGASNVARHYGMPPLLIGMVIIGFGTSAPELVVSTMSALQGNPGIALGNGYGSNIVNIALILGLTALLMPIAVNSQVLKKELPILVLITFLSVGLLWDLDLSRMDAIILLLVFAGIMFWTIKEGMKKAKDTLADRLKENLPDEPVPLKKSVIYLALGLLFLILSSRLLVYGAVGMATQLGVSDLIVGLTIVAIGTSLPELASSIIAARKGEPDMALGNVLGSNVFNTLAVVGLAGVIRPLKFDAEILHRDVFVMTLLTISLFVFGFSFKNRKAGHIGRFAGALLLITYVVYTGYLVWSALL